MPAAPNDTHIWDVLDTSVVPPCFTRFPAAINVGAKDCEDALRRIDEEAATPGTREYRRARIRHSNPFGDPFAICHCSAYPERLVLLASIVEVMWIHDDVTEELDFKAANVEHDLLAEVLRVDVEATTSETRNPRQQALAKVLRKALDLDPGQAELMIKTLKNYLKTFDNRDDDFVRMAEYMPYRIANCGYWISSFYIRWGMGITMSEEDYKSIEQFDIAMGNILGLTNDYFSWHVEKNQVTDRVRNGVYVLMKEHGLKDDVAKPLLLGVIVEEETKAARLKEQRLKKPCSEEIIRYFEAIELYVGGSCYWHATAPRYQVYDE